MLFQYFKVSLFSIILLSLAACASTKVQTTQQYAGSSLPKPDKILVYDFAVSPEEIKTNRAPGTKLANAVSGKPKIEQELAVGHAVAQSLSKALVKDLQARGLPAEYASTPPPIRGNVLVITGHFLNVDEGNRLQRMVIGFGAGGSKLQTQVQVFDKALANQQLIAEFNTEAKSSHKPGMGPLTGVGAVAGHAAVSLAASTALSTVSETFGADVEADAKRTAKKIVEQLVPLFKQQGWLPTTANS